MIIRNTQFKGSCRRKRRTAPVGSLVDGNVRENPSYQAVGRCSCSPDQAWVELLQEKFPVGFQPFIIHPGSEDVRVKNIIPGTQG